MRRKTCASSWKRINQNLNSRAKYIAQEQYLYLTTRGRRSGQPREIEIWFTERQGRFYIIAEYETSNWVQNLCADPHAEVRIQDRKFAALGRVLGSGKDPATSDRDLIREVQDLSRAKYGWGDGTVVELQPVDS
jgi:deazaflavin-dependent oxidoreductase (nitroreductase family)